MENSFFSQPNSSAMLFLKSFLLLAIILGLLYFLMISLKALQTKLLTKKKTSNLISVKEQLALDNQRRIILVNFDNKDYLIFIGEKAEFLLNSQNVEETTATDHLPFNEPSLDFVDMLKDDTPPIGKHHF